LISYPQVERSIVEQLAKLFCDRFGFTGREAIAGTATSGIPHAVLLADRLGLPFVYVAPGGDQEGGIKGLFTPGQQVIMVEDHITTGSSVLESAMALRVAGAHVDRCLAIFTYNTDTAKKRFEDLRIDLATLCGLDTLLDMATSDRRVSEEAANAVLDWVGD